MTWENSAITITTLLPLVGALVIAVMPKEKDRAVRLMGILVTGAALALAIAIAIGFDYGRDGLQYVLDVEWISVIGVKFHVGIDGISLPLYVLTFLLSFLCAIYSWRYVPDPGRTRAFLALMLLLETGMAGTFIAFDLILFFVFWEMVLVPMYFLIGIWGSSNREYAAIKFFLYTLFGSVFMLLGFLAMYFQGPDPHTFDMVKLQQVRRAGRLQSGFQLVVFGAVALGFAVKVPMWPFHTWLPDAHTEAPTIGSVLLAGVMLKMGTYGFIRIALPFLPQRLVVPGLCVAEPADPAVRVADAGCDVGIAVVVERAQHGDGLLEFSGQQQRACGCERVGGRGLHDLHRRRRFRRLRRRLRGGLAPRRAARRSAAIARCGGDRPAVGFASRPRLRPIRLPAFLGGRARRRPALTADAAHALQALCKRREAAIGAAVEIRRAIGGLRIAARCERKQTSGNQTKSGRAHRLSCGGTSHVNPER